MSACTAVDDNPIMGDVGGGMGFFAEIGGDEECDVFNVSKEAIIFVIHFGNSGR